MQSVQASETPDLLGNGGKMSALIGAADWSVSPLGSIETWPDTLRTAVDLMLASAFPMYVAWGRQLTFLYNDALIPILGSKHPNALGAPIASIWPETWPDVEWVINRALAGDTIFRRDMPVTMRRDGVQATAAFTFSVNPLRNHDREVEGVYCTCQETTAEVQARIALDAEKERLHELFRQAPGFMAVLQGPDHVVEIFNSAYRRLVGDRDLCGRTVREAFPEVEGQGFFELLDQAYRTGEPHTARRAPLTLKPTPDRPAELLYIDYVFQPIRDAVGNVTGVFVEGSDVTESARSDEERKLAVRFARATIDALAKHIAVIDGTGAILAVNRAWREFAAENGMAPSAVSEGANYLHACDTAAASGDKDAAEVAAIIRAVAAGERDSAVWEYACHAPGEERWFSVTITRFEDVGPVRVVVAHENLTEHHKSQQRIAYLATHDPLTDLPNRHHFSERAELAIRAADSDGTEVALLFLDLDGFKFLNDAYGHLMGDDVLKAVASELQGLVGIGLVARFGGDEFVVLLEGAGCIASRATEVAETIVTRFSNPLVLKDRDATVTASIGISIYPSDGHSLGQLLSNADAAMYRAKELGRNGFHFYSADMGARASERMLIESELRRALRANQFELHYQPQISLTTGAPVGMEALIRWSHPHLGDIQPSRFIPIAEEAGLIISIGRWALETACAQCRDWQMKGLPALPVAVNISAAQLRHPDFVGFLKDVLARTNLEPQYLDLEITEGVVMDRTESIIAQLEALKALGVGLSIDDFGTGYSNLAYLKSFPIDRLKIDRSFIAGLPDDANAMAITTAILALGHSLGLVVVAEGVETGDQAAALRAAGCEQAQGFLYSVPLTAPKMARWLRENGDRTVFAALKSA